MYKPGFFNNSARLHPSVNDNRPLGNEPSVLPSEQPLAHLAMSSKRESTTEVPSPGLSHPMSIARSIFNPDLKTHQQQLPPPVYAPPEKKSSICGIKDFLNQFQGVTGTSQACNAPSKPHTTAGVFMQPTDAERELATSEGSILKAMSPEQCLNVQENTLTPENPSNATAPSTSALASVDEQRPLCKLPIEERFLMAKRCQLPQEQHSPHSTSLNQEATEEKNRQRASGEVLSAPPPQEQEMKFTTPKPRRWQQQQQQCAMRTGAQLAVMTNDDVTDSFPAPHPQKEEERELLLSALSFNVNSLFNEQWADHASTKPCPASREEGALGRARQKARPSFNESLDQLIQAASEPLPIVQFGEDEVIIQKRFSKQYAVQEDKDVIAAHLKTQINSTLGTIGTLDVNKCLDIIDSHDVTLIVTDTGTGKSTLIPKGLLQRHPEAMVVNCQPRRTSAINLAQRVAQLLGEKEMGMSVGYSVRGEHAGVLGETRLMYVTNYTLFLYLLWRNPEHISFSHIILDEFHERTAEVELMLPLFMLILRHFPRKFKLILCSATAQVSEWLDFFDGLSVGQYNQANEMYPVYMYFMEDICNLIGSKCGRFSIRYDNTVESLQMNIILENIKELLMFLINATDPQHGILVFLPGRINIENFACWIRKKLSSKCEAIPWYSEVDLSVIQDALCRKATTKKKVYLATDIAEVSLTLPDVVFLIDSGMGKRPQVSEIYPYSVAFPPLKLLWEGSMNARQRRGRVGRVQQGFYFCMLFKDHYNKLGSGDCRITNSVLNELVLHSLQLSSTPYECFQLCREQPRCISIEHSLRTLEDGGFIIPKGHMVAPLELVRYKDPEDVGRISAFEIWNHLIEWEVKSKQSGEGKVKRGGAEDADVVNAAALQAQVGQDEQHIFSLFGKLKISSAREDFSKRYVPYQVMMKGIFVSRLPTSIEPASIVFYSVMFGTPVLGIVAAAVESVKTPFITPYDVFDKVSKLKSCEEVSKIMRSFMPGMQSDIVVSIMALLEYMSLLRNNYTDEEQERWCETHFLSRTRLTDTLNLILQIKDQLGMFFPFTNVTDIDELRQQFNQHAALINFICIGTHLQWAINVEYQGSIAAQQGYDGRGIFINMSCAKDVFIPSVCTWASSSICVPFSLRSTYDKLRANFAIQTDSFIFNLATLLFTFRVVYELLEEKYEKRMPIGHDYTDPNHRASRYLFQVNYMKVMRTFICDVRTGQQILQLRRIMCARLCTMQVIIEGGYVLNETKMQTEALRKCNSDFGLPESVINSPNLIPSLLQYGLLALLKRFDATLEVNEGGSGSKGDAYCKAVPSTVQSSHWTESLIIHSSNGIFPHTTMDELNESSSVDENSTGNVMTFNFDD